MREDTTVTWQEPAWVHTSLTCFYNRPNGELPRKGDGFKNGDLPGFGEDVDVGAALGHVSEERVVRVVVLKADVTNALLRRPSEPFRPVQLDRSRVGQNDLQEQEKLTVNGM